MHTAQRLKGEQSTTAQTTYNQLHTIIVQIYGLREYNPQESAVLLDEAGVIGLLEELSRLLGLLLGDLAEAHGHEQSFPARLRKLCMGVHDHSTGHNKAEQLQQLLKRSPVEEIPAGEISERT